MKSPADSYTRYPLWNVVIYNSITVLHYVLGSAGLILGYQGSSAAHLAGFVYLAFAVAQMYVLMPFIVCPNCVYYVLDHSRCISALNVVSRKVTGRGELHRFADRGQGFFCHNNLYMAALIVPIIGMIPALALHFSFTVLAVFVVLIALLLYRIFVVFPKLACVYCRAKNVCPNAQSMGIADSPAET